MINSWGMQNENLEVVHEHTGELAGLSLPRHDIIRNRHWCRSTNIFVLNSNGDVLCHQRSLNKERYPGVWFTHSGGHVADSETYESNALKELEEEIGLRVKPEELIHWRTTRIDVSRLWAREFMTVYDGPLENLVLQEEEVEQVRWFSAEEILKLYKDNPQMWQAGTHDFASEYQCLRAVLTACISSGVFHEDFHALHKWHPLVA